jgi:EAL domain-containing protein (putative c-di-GMP-specific phosphodiesterase class I)
VVDLGSGQIRGAEALLRWDHPKRGLLLPDEFLDVAEDTGLIVPIGAWVLRAAARQAQEWVGTDPQVLLPRAVAVNVSVRQLADPTLRESLEELLADGVVTPEMLQLEITESQYMVASELMLRELAALRGLGFTLCLDDFGTGYSSLSYLKHFPFDVVKLDRSYVGGLGQDRGDDAIVTAVLALANALDLDTVAEGVETEHQARLLADMGCRHAQGYYFGRPSRAADLAAAGVTPRT